jgi:hypothetical protein
MPTRAPSGRLTIFERAEDLPPVWERLARGRALALEPRFLQAVQPCLVDGSNRRYLVYESDDGATVIAAAVLLEPPLARNPVTSVLLGRLGGRLPSSRHWMLPMLVLRPELTADPPYCSDAVAPALRAATMRGLVAALGQQAQREGWSLAIDSVPAGDAAMTAALSEGGYLRTLGRPCASMRIEWDSWESYRKAAGRQSKRAATNIQTETNRARREGLAIVDWNTTAIPEAQLHRLMVEHEERLNGRACLFRPGLFARLSASLGSDVSVLLGMRDGQLQGLTAFARTGSHGYMTYPGFVDKPDRAGSVYFNLIFYHPVRLAIELGLESISFGNAALEAKIRRGCAVQAGALCFKPRNRVLRMALGAPVALHRQALQRKYAGVLGAAPFSNVIRHRHANSADERAS